MARQKLSEYRSKILVSEALDLKYTGWGVDVNKPLDDQLEGLDDVLKYVVKVDQGIKGRFKKGLVVLGVAKDGINNTLAELHSKGYEHFIVEPQLSHNQSDERYIAITYDKAGLHLSYSEKGGVDIESNKDSINIVGVNESTNWEELSRATKLAPTQLKALIELVEKNFITLLEINPYLSKDGSVLPLDAAIEVDDSGSYFVDSWTQADFRRSSSKKLTPEEVLVHELDENSPASLKLEVLNPDGSIFLLLSGGGASVVVADEIYNLGLGERLANYGEYSGNPNIEETYLYTKSLLQLLIASSSEKKVLFIGGAVANFTDIANTFGGIIKAIAELNESLNRQGVKVFVRRGGPRQEIGLKKIEEALKKHNLLGAVYDPTTPLTEAVASAVEAVK